MLNSWVLLSVWCVLCYGEKEKVLSSSAVTTIPNNVTNTKEPLSSDSDDNKNTTTIQEQQVVDLHASTDLKRKHDDVPTHRPKLYTSRGSGELDTGTSIPSFPESIKTPKHKSKKTTAVIDITLAKKGKKMRSFHNKIKSLVMDFMSNSSVDFSAATTINYTSSPLSSNNSPMTSSNFTITSNNITTTSTTTDRPVLRINDSMETQDVKAVRRADGEKRRLPQRQHPNRAPLAEELDMAPARGEFVETLRDKNRLCHRHVLVPEGPKYDSRGKQYLAEYSPVRNRKYHQTSPPRLLLPKCCNCCKKSVLGCQ